MNKKLLILFVIVFVSLNSYSQNSLTKDETLQLQQIQNYSEYVKFCNEHSIPPKTETVWIYDVFYQADYKLKQDIQNINNSLISSGTYLIKARKQILSGFGAQVFSGLVIYVGSNIYTNKLADATHPQEIIDIKRERNAYYIGAGVLSLVGLGFEISGIMNIGNAGISLNEHGVGVRVKF